LGGKAKIGTGGNENLKDKADIKTKTGGKSKKDRGGGTEKCPSRKRGKSFPDFSWNKKKKKKKKTGTDFKRS